MSFIFPLVFKQSPIIFLILILF